MSFHFRPAVRENVPLLIGLAGGTGSGKTMSALLLARGLAGGKPFAGIDTENGRMLHYADEFPELRHARLDAPYRPDRYVEALEAADKEFGVIVVDSVSHEWAGDGGVIDWQLDEYERLGGRDAIKLLSWSAPKQGHRRMVTRLLQLGAHVILCFRAEPKVDMVKNERTGKMEIVPKASLTGLDGWMPITEKNLPFELTASFLLMADAPGVPRPIKLPEQLRQYFPLDKRIGEDAGVALAAWAAGGTSAAKAAADTSALEHELVDLLRQLGADHRVVDKHRGDASWLARNLARAQEKLAAQSAEGSTSEPDGPGDDAPRDSPLAEPGEPVDTDVQAAVSSDVVLIPVFGTGKSPKIGTPLADAGDEWVAWARQTAVATPDFFPDKFVVILKEWKVAA